MSRDSGGASPRFSHNGLLQPRRRCLLRRPLLPSGVVPLDRDRIQFARPAAYYFRAFNLLRQGRVDEARGDMLTGALLEAQQPRRFAIGSALERIQGCDRLMLEEFRRSARREAATGATTSRPQPAATFAPTAPNNAVIREGEANVLREQRVVPLEELLRPGGPNSIAVEPATAPPAVPPQDTQPAGKAAPQPAATPAPAGNDPFADDASGAAAPATPAPATPPQDAPSATPQPTPPATPPADPGDNPFG